MMKLFALGLAILLAGCGQGGNQGSAPADSGARQAVQTPASGTRKTILFFGNSLTAGYGLPDPNLAFPALIQASIDSLKWEYTTVNAGNSGETSSGGLSRIDWVLKQPVDVFVLELGANDGLRGVPVSETAKNLQAIVGKVKAKYPACKLVLLGMQVPPNLGQDYTDAFKRIFPALAEKNNMALVPFLLAGVGGVPSLNQQDGIHPNTEGERIVAANVWAVLKGLLSH